MKIRPCTILVLLFILPLMLMEAQENPFIPTRENSWVPDLSAPMDAPSPIDLRVLNETEAGEHGFIRLSEDGRSFLRGDGQPIRFWAVHASTYPKNWGKEGNRDYARGLARMGVNLALAGAMPEPDKSQDDPKVVDPKILDDLWLRVATLKEQGIYSTVRGTWFHGGVKHIDAGIEGYGVGKNLNNVIFFSPRLQEIYKGWVKQMLTTENPYTGIPLAKEPAVAAFTFFNEDSPLFYSLMSLKGEPLRNAQQQFAQWAIEEYGSLSKALDAWGGPSVEGDDIKAGRLGIMSWWFASVAVQKDRPNAVPRVRAQAQFIADMQNEFYADMEKWLREKIGAEQLILTSNFRPAAPDAMTDLEMWVKARGDVIAGNSYPGASTLMGKNRSWMAAKDTFMQYESITKAPLEIPQVQRQVANHPFWISETMWPNPHEYSNEAALLSSIYANVAGQTAASFAGPRSIRWGGDSLFLWNNSAIHRFNCSEPGQMSPFPAAALIARMGYGVQSKPAVVEHRSFDEIADLKPPMLSPGVDFDALQDDGNPAAESDATSHLPQEAFLMGAVMVDFTEGQDVIAPEVLNYGGGDIIRSLDGNVMCDRDKGLVTLDTPEAQAIIGFLNDAGPVTLSSVSIESQNEHIAVTVIALDGQSIEKSKKIFVQLSPRARPTGWDVEPAQRKNKQGKLISGWKITSLGKAPFRMEKIQGYLSIRNNNLTTATLLDAMGQETKKVQLNKNENLVHLQLPETVIYMILE